MGEVLGALVVLKEHRNICAAETRPAQTVHCFLDLQPAWIDAEDCCILTCHVALLSRNRRRASVRVPICWTEEQEECHADRWVRFSTCPFVPGFPEDR